ncbi:MAG: glycine betaine ABC transporter substrate-binding protein [Longicatena sp.]
MIQDILDLWMQKSDFYLELLLEHIQISMTAIIIAGCLGLCIGILIAEYQKTSKVALGVINFMYTIPSISLLGFLIPLSGIGNTTAILALTIYALLPMVRNTHTGLVNVQPLIIEAAKGMGSTRFQILYKIKLPLAMPVIMSGIRNMAVMTIALAGIASFIGAGGLGVAIYRGITTNNKAMTIIGSLMIALLALFIDWMLGFVEKVMNRRGIKNKEKKKKVLIISVGIISICTLFYTLTGSSNKDTIHIATKPMSEQYVIGEMLRTLIEQDTDLEVDMTQGVGGGTNNIHPAMVSKEFDLYPEYTGTGWSQVLKESDLYTEDLFDRLQDGYHNLGMKWESLLGFNNTFGIAVRKEIAEEYNLKTYSDLQKVADQLTFGAEYDYFERADGYDAFCEKYGLTFKNTTDLDIGLKYDAIREHKIDAMVVFTTDGQLAATEITVLKDDKNLYPSYMCGFVVREEILEKYPEIKGVLKKLDHAISDSDMSQMNYLVETKKQEPKDVADEFLKKKGLLE